MRCAALHLRASGVGSQRRFLNGLAQLLAVPTSTQKPFFRGTRGSNHADASSDNSTTSAPSTSTASTYNPLPASSQLLQPQQIQQLNAYLDYMLEVNKSMNLTAVTDRSEAWDRHIVDSLVLLPILDEHVKNSMTARSGSSSSSSSSVKTREKKQKKIKNPRQTSSESVSVADFAIGTAPPESDPADVGAEESTIGEVAPRNMPIHIIDVGTGAGLPGMVLAAARPQWKVTLLDSLRKRCDFLSKAVEVAGLTNVDVVWCRAEEGGRRPELREAHDIAIARAVADSAVLAELCLPFVRVGGLWVAPKGPRPEEEVAGASNAIKTLGGKQLALEMVDSYSQDGQRTCLVVSKVAPTGPKFPRTPGTPGKNPIK